MNKTSCIECFLGNNYAIRGVESALIKVSVEKSTTTETSTGRADNGGYSNAVIGGEDTSTLFPPPEKGAGRGGGRLACSKGK